MSEAPARRVRRIVVPYHHAEPLPALAGAFAADDAVIVSKGPAGAMIVRLYEQVAARVAASDEPVVVASGDCTTSLAIVSGLQRRALRPLSLSKGQGDIRGVIWLDAHGDFHTPHTTRSGYFGGMALAMLAGRAGASLAQSIGLQPIAEHACVLAGARALDRGELDNLASSAVRRIDDVASLADEALPPPPWYVHLDIDVIDPSDLPPLRFPAPGGPSASAVAAALRALGARGTIAALGLACTLLPKAFERPDSLAAVSALVDAAFESPVELR